MYHLKRPEAWIILFMLMVVGTGCAFRPLSVDGVRYVRPAGPGQLKVKLLVENPNRFAVKWKDPEIRLSLGDDVEATWSERTTWRLKPGITEQEAVVDLPLLQSLIGAGRLAGQLLKGETVKVRVEGHGKGGVFLFYRAIDISEEVAFSVR